MNDMATKQAATLGRVAALREGVLRVMKQHFPAQFSAAERQLGHKLGAREDADSVLLAFLEGFVRTHSPTGALAAPVPPVVDGLDELRAALTGAGFPVPAGADLRAWADQVNAARAAGAPAAPTEAPSAPPAPGAGAGGAVVPADEGGEPVGAVVDTGEVFWGEEAQSEPPADASGWDLGSLFDDPSPTPAPASDGVDAADLVDQLFHAANSPEAVPSTQAQDAPASAPRKPRRNKRRGKHSGASVLEESPFAPVKEDRPAATDHEGAPDPKPTPERERSADKPVEVHKSPPDVAPPAPEHGPAQGHQASQAVDDSPAAGAPVPAARTESKVLKPAMFPATQVPRPARARKPTRVPRVSAEPPADDEVPAVATERFGELVEAVAGPGPVFMSDLVRSSGSPGLVAAWEQHFMDQGTAAPVRVITPRGHHRARGALVVPHSPDLRQEQAERGPALWTECLQGGADRPRLRGARLYEVAVLLHKFADQVVWHQLNSNVLMLRLSTPQGLTGVVMWVGADSPAGPAGKQALAEALGQMVADRMVLLAVLTHESGARAVERLAGLVAEAAEENKWTPPMPVVASHSWEFASDGGASSLAVL